MATLKERISDPEEDLVVLRNGILSLVEVLSEKDIIQNQKFSHLWENRIMSDIHQSEERIRFLENKEGILMLHKSRDRSPFESLIQEAEDFIRSGNIESALDVLKKALRKDTGNYRLHYYIAQTLYLHQDMKQAMKHFRKAVDPAAPLRYSPLYGADSQ
ncbi:MAG: hypothetical protein MZV49_09220 [Rhodopseudomonas palustris]|nr:hypothetical protein [Rhodopseudomonas palustris]